MPDKKLALLLKLVPCNKSYLAKRPFLNESSIDSKETAKRASCIGRPSSLHGNTNPTSLCSCCILFLRSSEWHLLQYTQFLNQHHIILSDATEHQNEKHLLLWVDTHWKLLSGLFLKTEGCDKLQ